MEAVVAVALSRRGRLREETDAIHQTIDAQISEAGSLTCRNGYNAYVLATLQARLVVEATLAASDVSRFYPSWPDRAVSSMLQKDAHDLGLRIDSTTGPSPSKPKLSRGGVWGALYVLEGSSLGARVLQRRVEAIGMSPTFGARHLAHQTRNAGAWKTFVTLLDNAQLSAAEEGDCLRAAVATFRTFERTYSEGSGC